MYVCIEDVHSVICIYIYIYTYVVSSGTWVWADGVNSAYTRWGSSEPNGGTGENCVLMDGGYFQDWSCSTTIVRYVCSTCGQVPCSQVCSPTRAPTGKISLLYQAKLHLTIAGGLSIHPRKGVHLLFSTSHVA
jgi:hypothetical protein